jgi:thiopurine S-methyltransferase
MPDITTPDYWNQRYLDGNTPWDIGYPSPPITEYLQKKVNKSSRILIPGAGNAHEAGWLWENGFRNTWVMDIAEKPLTNIAKRHPA